MKLFTIAIIYVRKELFFIQSVQSGTRLFRIKLELNIGALELQAPVVPMDSSNPRVSSVLFLLLSRK